MYIKKIQAILIISGEILTSTSLKIFQIISSVCAACFLFILLLTVHLAPEEID